MKENITFGFPYLEKHFARIIQMCALNTDINLLPSNQHTIIGGRGVALSGGQKQRLMIARMLYSKPDIILLVKYLFVEMSNNYCEILLGNFFIFRMIRFHLWIPKSAIISLKIVLKNVS